MQLFEAGLHNLSLPEIIAALFGVLSVIYARQNNIWVYPTGIISVVLYAVICFQYGLYADAGLNIYYFIMSVYGWYNWVQKNDQQQYEYPISWCNRKERLVACALFIVLWAVIYVSLVKFTPSTVPVLDSFVSATACSGMWLMAKRKIENWIAWIISDSVAIPLFFYKHLLVTSLQFLIFLLLAWMGYVSWKKKRKKELTTISIT